MTKKIIASLVILIILVAGGLYSWSWLNQSKVSVPSNLGTSSSKLFPAGENRSLNANLIGSASRTASSTSVAGQLDSRFARVTSTPVADLLLLGQNASTTLWYIEKNTGHLYQVGADNRPQLVSNSTITKVGAFTGALLKTGPTFVINYQKDGLNQNLLTTISGTSTDQLGGRILPATATNFIGGSDTAGLFYLDRQNNETRLITSDWQFKKTKTLFSSSLNEWRVALLGPSLVVLTTKPSAAVNGYTYLFNLKSGQLTRLIDNVPGLEILPSPNGEELLYSGSGDRGPFLGLYDLKKQKITRLALNTLVDKCTWSTDSVLVFCGAPTELPSAVYPDDWLNGQAALADKLWQINTSTNQIQLVFNPSLQNSQQRLDVWKLVYNQNNRHLYLINKADLSLWSLDLSLGF